MSRNLQNKTVVITGGAVGIGYEIADSFLNKKAKAIIILDIDEEKGAEAVKALKTKYGNDKVVFYKCDVTNDLEVVYKKIIDTFETVDVLVNNAGILNESYVRKTIDINVTATIEWSFKFWEHMRNGKGGTIINIASIYGFRFDQFVPVYQASKAAVMGFTKSIGHNYNFSRFGVRVVAICPGFTETKLTTDLKTRFPEANDDYKKYTKQQLWQKVDAIGKAAVDVFETADSGTAWVIEGGQPIVEVNL